MKCREEFPNASREVLSNMYVDDCITGTDDVGVTVESQQSLLKMMELVQVAKSCQSRSQTKSIYTGTESCNGRCYSCSRSIEGNKSQEITWR